MKIYKPVDKPTPTFSQVVDAFGGPAELARMLHRKFPERYKPDKIARVSNWRKTGIPRFVWWDLVNLPHARVLLFPKMGRTVKLTLEMLEGASAIHEAAVGVPASHPDPTQGETASG